MTRDDAQSWLDAYIAAWTSYDRAAIEALFTDNAEYRYHPWDDPIEGGAAIADDWLSDRDQPDRWSAEYVPFAVDGEIVVATGTSTYTNPDGSPRTVYENAFLIRFGGDGRCSQFTEFFMERPGAE